MNAIVLSNGELAEVETLRKRLETLASGLVIGADAGSRHAETLGLELDVIVGDLDSLSATIPAGIDVLRAPAAKDETDLELALLEAMKRGATRIVLIGALGGRLDMTLANLLLLTHEDLRDVHVEVWHGEQSAWLIRPPGADISGAAGDTLSLIPLGGAAEGIMTHRLAYPLRNETLYPGPARGISNVLESEEVRVDLKAGLLLAVHTPGRA